MNHPEMNASSQEMAALPQIGGNSSGVPMLPINPMMMEYPLQDISVPHPHDVLCGRGGATNNHLGNSHWRMLVATNKELYVSLPKRQKQLLSRSIVHAVRSQNPPGRFLQRDPKSDLWYDVGDARATEKTSQALREGAPKLRDKIVKTSTASFKSEETTEATKKKTPATTPSAPVAETEKPAITSPQPNTVTSAKVEKPSVQNPEPVYSNSAQEQHKERNIQESYRYYQHEHPQSDREAEAMPPPPMPMTSVDFSFGAMSIPDAPDSGLENGYSFGSVMSVDPQQRQRQNPSRFSGSSMPTDSQTQEIVFGSMIMSEAEQRRLEQNMIREEQQNRHKYLHNQQHHCPARIDERHKEDEAPLPVDYGLEAGNSALSMMSIGTVQTISDTEQQHHHHHYTDGADQTTPIAVSSGSMAAARELRDLHGQEQQQYRQHHYDEPAPQPVDYGLEAGSSALSMMSIGTIKLDDGGTSFGSVMSFATNNRHSVPGTVDGGLEDVGASFGSMTIGGGGCGDDGMTPPPPPVKGAFEPPEPSAEPTFLHQQRSKANLLDCSDSDSEDEQHSAQPSLQKSADWAKLKATFESQMQSGKMATSAATPPSLNGRNSGRGDSSPVVLPTAVGRSETNDSFGKMPPPASRTEEDAWHAYEATLLNRGNSLADEQFNVPKQADDSA